MAQTIYYADDEKNIRDLIYAFLTREGYTVKTFGDGDDLLEEFGRKVPDLVILDIMMPKTDGFSVCSLLRAKSPDLPIMIVSAKDSPYDKVAGLTLGSDDYLVKPFFPMELVARVKALLRRVGRSEKTVDDIGIGSVTVSLRKRTVDINGEVLRLTPMEFDLFAYLAAHRDCAVSRQELLDNLWKMNWEADTRAADDLVKRLRKKIGEQNLPVRIETVWGYGFRLVCDEA